MQTSSTPSCLPTYEEATQDDVIAQTSNFSSLPPYSSDGNFYRDTRNVQQNIQATLHPYPNFVVQRDVFKLRSAIQGFNETTLTNILCNRSEIQRRDIAELFKKIYSKPIQKNIKFYTGGRTNYSVLMCGLVSSKAEFIARQVHNAVNFEWMLQIVFLLSNQQRNEMRSYFETKYKIDIFAFILNKMEKEKSDTKILPFIRKMITTERDSEYDRLDQSLIQTDINNLISIRNASNNSESQESILSFFYERSFPHILAVSKGFEQRTQIPHKIFINDNFPSSANIINSFVQYATSPPVYFATILISILVDSKYEKFNINNIVLLSSIVLMRCEVDLGEIKRVYEMSRGTTLKDDIRDSSSGSYKKALLKLIGERR